VKEGAEYIAHRGGDRQNPFGFPASRFRAQMHSIGLAENLWETQRCAQIRLVVSIPRLLIDLHIMASSSWKYAPFSPNSPEAFNITKTKHCFHKRFA